MAGYGYLQESNPPVGEPSYPDELYYTFTLLATNTGNTLSFDSVIFQGVDLNLLPDPSNKMTIPGGFNEYQVCLQVDNPGNSTSFHFPMFYCSGLSPMYFNFTDGATASFNAQFNGALTPSTAENSQLSLNDVGLKIVNENQYMLLDNNPLVYNAPYVCFIPIPADQGSTSGFSYMLSVVVFGQDNPSINLANTVWGLTCTDWSAEPNLQDPTSFSFNLQLSKVNYNNAPANQLSYCVWALFQPLTLGTGAQVTVNLSFAGFTTPPPQKKVVIQVSGSQYR